jgi:hypothetical protein
MSLSWLMFEQLCSVTNAFEQLRERYEPGSDGWCALVELVHALDDLIDELIETDGIAED